jgi:hypothetical protein
MIELLPSPIRPNHSQVMWRDIGGASLELCDLREGEYDDGNLLSGHVLLEHAGRPMEIHYRIETDERWRTLMVNSSLRNLPGNHDGRILLWSDGEGRWRSGEGDGAHAPEFDGTFDVDLGFTPATNLLPIRRLSLDVGQSAPVRAVWLQFPEFQLQPFQQTYTRLTKDTYRYQSEGGFESEITVDERGLPVTYRDGWERIAQLP